MLKRFGLAGLLFASLAVAPLTVAAQDRNEGWGHNEMTQLKVERVENTRYTAARQNRSHYTRENQMRDRNRDRDSQFIRRDNHRNSYDYR
jgi:hypothetical protein